jgi:hypothetical protein
MTVPPPTAPSTAPSDARGGWALVGLGPSDAPPAFAAVSGVDWDDQSLRGMDLGVYTPGEGTPHDMVDWHGGLCLQGRELEVTSLYWATRGYDRAEEMRAVAAALPVFVGELGLRTLVLSDIVETGRDLDYLLANVRGNVDIVVRSHRRTPFYLRDL